jgi:uncharacterized protein with FMN-binding domain
MPHPTRIPVLSVSLAALLGVAVAVGIGKAGALSPPASPRAPIHASVMTAVSEPATRRNPLLHLVSHSAPGYRDGRFTGPAFDAYYGWVQVQAIVQSGKLTAVRVLRYPSDRSTSRRIARFALPRLEREVIRAQSSRVNAISGATLTSDAYLQSIHAALRQASS